MFSSSQCNRSLPSSIGYFRGLEYFLSKLFCNVGVPCHYYNAQGAQFGCHLMHFFGTGRAFMLGASVVKYLVQFPFCLEK